MNARPTQKQIDYPRRKSMTAYEYLNALREALAGEEGLDVSGL